MSDRINFAIAGYIQELELFVAGQQLTSAQKAEKQKQGQYEHIPLNHFDFYKQVEIVAGFFKQAEVPAEFVDVGCGIGTKLVLAKRCFSDCDMPFKLSGIEITPEYIEMAKKLTTHKTYNPPQAYANIIEADALTFDYKTFDIIYFYCPLQDNNKQKELEKRIIETAHPGAYILANLRRDYEIWTKPPIKHIWRSTIFQKMNEGG